MKINQLNTEKGLITGYKTANKQLNNYLKTKGHVIKQGLKNQDLNFVNYLHPFNYLKMRLSSKPTITQALTTSGDLDYNYNINKIIKQAIIKYITKFCNDSDKVITISNYAKKCLIKAGVKKNITVISSGVDLDKIKKTKKQRKKLRTEFRQEFNIKKNELVALNVGLRIMRKGLAEFYKLAKIFPKIRFVWVGGNLRLANNRKVVKKIINSKLENLVFTGYYENIHKAYYGSDFLLFPTKGENEGITIMEAAGHELPIITSNLEVIKEKITNNQTGLLCKNINDYKQAIKKIESKKERARLSTNALRIIKKYDMNKVIKKLIKVFKELIKAS